MPLAIHIGYHKTGSTALQKWLAANSIELERFGLHYPTGLSSWFGHPELAWACAEDQYPWQDRAYTLEEVVEHYREALEQSRHPRRLVVISSEEFCRLDFSIYGIMRLKEALAEYRPYIIGFFRSPIEFLVSRYRHEVQNGSERRAIRHFLTDIDNILSANFHSRTLVWKQCFEGRTIFRNYSRDNIRNDITVSFLDCVGLSHIDRSGLININESEEELKISPSLIDVVRQIKSSELDMENTDKAFYHIFELSKILGSCGMEKFLADLGITEETYRLLGSLQLNTIDQSGNLASFEFAWSEFHSLRTADTSHLN